MFVVALLDIYLLDIHLERLNAPKHQMLDKLGGGSLNLGRVGIITRRERHTASFEIIHIEDIHLLREYATCS